MGFAPTWLRQVSRPPPLLHMNTLTTGSMAVHGAPTDAHTVLPRATKFGGVTNVEQRRVSSRSVTPHPKSAGLQRSLNISGTPPCLRENGLTQCLHVVDFSALFLKVKFILEL